MAPQSHPQAQFVPITPDFDVHALVESAENFDYVTRLSTEKLREHSSQSFEALVLSVVIQSGKPLVIEDWGPNLPSWLFSGKWLEDNLGLKHESVRDIPNGVDIPMTMGHYLRSMSQLTKQFSKQNYRDPKRQRLYLKDIDCPEEWANHLKETIPECVYYLNHCIESRTGGDGAIREPNEYGQMGYGKGVAPAGDLMSSLPPEMRALNMMCYVGHEGTYTPAHREMCASLGHNIMVETSQDGHGEKAGSSIWFMTETKEREVVSEYFLSMLGHDIEVEKHFAQVNAWKKAPFNVWVVEQKVGDLILIPPLAPHQVWNRGTRTIKAAWNRTTVDTLELALHEALPRARMVCRDEQYKCKAITYYTLIKYYNLLQRETIEPKMWKYGRIKQVLDDFKRLFSLYQEILVSEMFSPKLPDETDVEFLPYDSNITCSYCRCNIFNRFLTCKSCILHGPNREEDTYDVCMDCYTMGRSCACISNLKWVEQWDWNTLVQNYEQWRNVIVQSDGYFDAMRSPQLDIARKRYGKKPIAEVCQDQLKIRPWIDITKPREPTPEMSEPEPEVDDEGRIKHRKKGRKSKFSKAGRGRIDPMKDKTHGCHICFHHEWNWKLAFCTTCNLAYCYGTLWRAFDLMPQTVMEDKEWQCPRCLKICSCGKCRKGNVQVPYQPKGTLLGHDTKKVADYRSVESLVDFSKTNLGWLRDEDADKPNESVRMKRLKEKAEADKARVDGIDDSYVETGSEHPYTGNEPNELDMTYIDPSLRDAGMVANDSGSHNTLSEPLENTSNGHETVLAHQAHQDETNGWNDDLPFPLGRDDYNSYNPQSAAYPSRLFAPVAPTLNPEPSYPDPSHVGQNRMMGIGFYQQGTGVDRILYDPPNLGSSTVESPQRPKQNPNLALSDLLDPALQPTPENQRKRKRFEGSGDEQDVEYFTSKKQKARAQAKKVHKYEQFLNDFQYPAEPPKPAKVPPRRSTTKPKTYLDLGEDAVPIEEDEGPSSVTRSYNIKKHSDSDLQLAAQAMKHISKSKAKEQPTLPTKRRSMRGVDLDSKSRPQVSPNTIKTPRKSAWLSRKEAEDADMEFPSELPKRTHKRRSVASGATAEVSSGPKDTVDNDDQNNILDSLFEEPRDHAKSPTADIAQNSSNVEKAQVADPQDTSILEDEREEPENRQNLEPSTVVVKPNVQVQVKRGRGRPRKNKSLPPVQLESPSPPHPGRPPIQKLLSLEEKLALECKSFKIRGPKQKSIGSTVAPNSEHASPPVAILDSMSVASPAGQNSVDFSNRQESSFETSPDLAPSRGPSTSISIPSEQPIKKEQASDSMLPGPAAPPVKKGPTVVRLLSPSPEYDHLNPSMPLYDYNSDSSSDDDEDIPAVIAPPKAAQSGRFSLRDR